MVMQQTTRVYHIEGMTFAACAARLEVKLTKLPGVTEAHVSFDDRTATIRSAIDEPGNKVIREAVEQAGFKSPTNLSGDDTTVRPK
ncbi:MAG: hypothetical protein KatS3mg104_2783 [Phycisphaerae bacterium]|jgi:Cu+-exporting ATPase|nr:MAG: hypothetical protein KatS3mg104_2783 [Phycisphaerae bacterium]